MPKIFLTQHDIDPPKPSRFERVIQFMILTFFFLILVAVALGVAALGKVVFA